MPFLVGFFRFRLSSGLGRCRQFSHTTQLSMLPQIFYGSHPLRKIDGTGMLPNLPCSKRPKKILQPNKTP